MLVHRFELFHTHAKINTLSMHAQLSSGPRIIKLGLNLNKRPFFMCVSSKVSRQYFDLHLAIISLENQFLVFFLSGRLRQVLLYENIQQGEG